MCTLMQYNVATDAFADVYTHHHIAHTYIDTKKIITHIDTTYEDMRITGSNQPFECLY